MDLSATHDRVGFIWVPKQPPEELPKATQDSGSRFDDLDVERLYAKIESLARQASTKVDAPMLRSDERQLWLGSKLAYQQVLRLFEPDPLRGASPILSNMTPELLFKP